MPHDMTHALAVAALGGDDCRTAAVAATASAARLLDSGAAHGSIAPLSIAAMHSMHAMDAAGSTAGSESEPAAGAMRNTHRAVSLPSDGMVLQEHDEPDTDPSDSTGGNHVSNDPQPAKGPLSFRAWLEGLGYIPMRSARCHLAMRKVPEVCPWGTLRWALSCDGLRLGRWCAGGLVRA